MSEQPRLQRVYRRPEAAAYLGLTRKTLDTYIHLGKIRKPFKLTPGGRADGYTEDMLIEIQQAAIKASEPRRKVERFRYRKTG